MKNSKIQSTDKNKIIKEARKIFIDYLKTHKLKITQERNRITDLIFSLEDHFSVEELEYLLRKQKMPTSRATIYRTLDLLVSCQLVNKLHFGEHCYYYEQAYGQPHHDHLICNQCHVVVHFSSDKVKQIQEQICQDNQFKLFEYTLHVFGLCKECQNAHSNRNNHRFKLHQTSTT